MVLIPGMPRFVAAMVGAQVLTQIGAFTLPALLPAYIERWSLSGRAAPACRRLIAPGGPRPRPLAPPHVLRRPFRRLALSAAAGPSSALYQAARARSRKATPASEAAAPASGRIRPISIRRARTAMPPATTAWMTARPAR